MGSFFRYIAYVDYYRNGEKIRNVGFLRWKFYDQVHILEIQIKDAFDISGSFWIQEDNTAKKIGKINIDRGIGSFEKKFPVVSASGERYLDAMGDRLYLRDIQGFSIGTKEKEYLWTAVKLEQEKLPFLTEPDGNMEVRDNLCENGGKTAEKTKVTVDKNQAEKAEEISRAEEKTDEDTDKREKAQSDLDRLEPKSEEMEAASENVLIDGIEEKYDDQVVENRMKILEPMYEDKWQQLCRKYPQVHPFYSKQTFLSIKPEDFIILEQGYQKLVHNSFLLHGFYNYGHMILGKLSAEVEAPYYIGVPGVFYEREKKAAQMFGFAGFESVEEPVQSGSYGYYMIEVKI